MDNYWFVSKKHHRLNKLAFFTFLLAFVVILLGAYTRLTNAGLSCPDWPHCYGFMTAPHTVAQLQDAIARYPLMPINIEKAWTEMTHRYFAGTEGILILILALSLLFRRQMRDLKITFISTGLLALLATQILLGMLTVTEKLRPIIVLSHLLTGLSILSLLWWAYLSLRMQRTPYPSSKSRGILPFIWLGFIFLVAQITLGGWVTTHYAGLACIDFPYCNGKIFPTLALNQFNNDLITIHMLHRIGAAITGIYLISLALFLFIRDEFRTLALFILALVIAQVSLGIFNVIWLRPIPIALLHHAVAILLLLTLITLLVKASFILGKHHDSWIT